MSTAAPKTVHTLVCHRDVGMAIKCLSSMQAFSSEQLAVSFHDDGSLTVDDRQRLEGEVARSSVLLRAHANEALTDVLRRHPACREARERNVLFMKLLDVTFFADQQLLYVDSDVLFLRPFRGLFDVKIPGISATFMADLQQAYSLRPWDIPLGVQRPLSGRINSGLIRADRRLFSPDRLEGVLRDRVLGNALARVPSWAEQTCWALLADANTTAHWNARQIQVASPALDLSDDAIVAVHFVSSYRGTIDFVPPQRQPPGPIDVRQQPADPCTFLDLAVQQGRSRLRRTWIGVRRRLPV